MTSLRCHQVCRASHGIDPLQVTTTTGAILQPLVIAPAIAFALAGLLAFAFLLLTLFAYVYVWDMIVTNLEPGRAAFVVASVSVWRRQTGRGGMAAGAGTTNMCAQPRRCPAEASEISVRHAHNDIVGYYSQYK